MDEYNCTITLECNGNNCEIHKKINEVMKNIRSASQQDVYESMHSVHAIQGDGKIVIKDWQSQKSGAIYKVNPINKKLKCKKCKNSSKFMHKKVKYHEVNMILQKVHKTLQINVILLYLFEI